MSKLSWSKTPTRGSPGRSHVAADELTRIGTDVLVAAGAPDPTARAVAESLVASDLAGHDSHGVRRLVPYLDAIRAGRLDPAATPQLATHSGATATVDGRRGFGQLAAALAAREARALAAVFGVGVAAVRNGNHIGRLGEYVERLANADAVGLGFCNSDPTVAPYRGRERLLGTNPIAWAVPRAPDRPAVVLDFSTAAVAEGKLAIAAASGERVPPGQVVDREGQDSTDPADFYAGGALLPFGDHKGYGLGVLIEIVGGLLSGAGISSLPGYDNTNGTVLVAIEIGRFLPVDRFRAQAERFCETLHRTEPAQAGEPVLVPGELEASTRERRLRDGIPLSEATWHELAALPGFPKGDSP